MAGSIRNIMTTAYLNVLSNPREARFVSRMQRVIGKAERRRKECLEKEGLEVPPFLINKSLSDAKAPENRSQDLLSGDLTGDRSKIIKRLA